MLRQDARTAITKLLNEYTTNELREALEETKPANPLRQKMPYDSPAFIQAWVDWVQHRKEIRKPLKPTSTKKQLQQLAKWGEERAVKSIEYSITNGWTGLWEPKDSDDQKPTVTVAELLAKEST